MAKDPRIAILVEIMERSRMERARRIIEVRDMRRKDGRVSMQDEAREMLAALDKHDAALWETAIQKARAYRTNAKWRTS